MPRFYLTAVAAAVMAATVNAAEFPAIPTDQTDYNEIIYRDDANDPTSYEQSSWNGIGLVASGEPMSSGSKAPAFLSTAKGDIVTNNGSIWVLADRIPDNKLGQYASGILASGGKKGVNAEGAVIYVHSDNNGEETNYEAAKGMVADASTGDATTIINKGTIYVEGGTGMLATSNAKDRKSEITNEGTIHVINSGFGMSLGSNNASGVEMTNKGTIIASGKNAYGITASDATDGTVTNEGTIIATDGAIAISSGRWNKDVEFSLTLKGNSHVEGVIELGKASHLIVQDLARAETIVLSSGTPEKVNALDGAQCEGCNVGSVTVKNSNLTIRSKSDSLRQRKTVRRHLNSILSVPKRSLFLMWTQLAKKLLSSSTTPVRSPISWQTARSRPKRSLTASVWARTMQRLNASPRPTVCGQALPCTKRKVTRSRAPTPARVA